MTNCVSVIDIGSNSVRLVVYDGLKSSATALFNEKSACALAKDLYHTNKLNPKGVKLAKQSVRRFVALSRRMHVSQIIVFATSAVREAKDGKSFVLMLEKEHGISITIISGRKEAELAAYGIRAATYKPKGIVGDLGGGSLELALLDDRTVEQPSSYLIGTLRLLAESANSPLIASTIIENTLKNEVLIQQMKGKTFYAIGGSYRSIAKVHMDEKQHPIRMVHHYRVSATDLLPLLAFFTEADKEVISHMNIISSKRSETLVYSALVLKKIIELGKPKEVVFSSHGVREGMLYTQLPKDEQKKDVLIVGAENLCTQMYASVPYGYELYEWLEPLIEIYANKEDKRLYLAACLLSEIACLEHTEYRATMAYQMMIDSTITGLEHSERIFIAVALMYRYSSTANPSLLYKIHHLLPKRQLHAARVLGHAFRVARNLTGGIEGNLSDIALLFPKKKEIILRLTGSAIDLAGETLEKRFNKLASRMQYKGAVEIV